MGEGAVIGSRYGPAVTESADLLSVEIVAVRSHGTRVQRHTGHLAIDRRSKRPGGPLTSSDTCVGPAFKQSLFFFQGTPGI